MNASTPTTATTATTTATTATTTATTATTTTPRQTQQQQQQATQQQQQQQQQQRRQASTVFEAWADSSSDSNRWKAPDTWTTVDDGSKKGGVLVEVSPYYDEENGDDDEYWEVHERLQASMGDAHISKLWRVQNPNQWANFILHKLRLEMQGVSVHEKSLWHGKSSLDPSAIYNDNQDGFMMQYARQGMWGFGTYFAENSSYSDNYAFNGAAAQITNGGKSGRPANCDGEKEMFLVTILEGRSVHLPASNPALRVPPTDLKGQRYNSVTANTNGSKIWVVYENGRAYPSYLVRYYRGRRDPLRTPLAARPQIAFEWQFDDGMNGWTPYSSKEQKRIEKCWKSDAKSQKLAITTPHHKYELNFITMTQTNVSHPNRTVRQIRR